MRTRVVKSSRRLKKQGGKGFVNTLINKLPFEAHIPGYQYCGPGTKLAKRLQRGDRGINSLDEACRQHDIAYSQYGDTRNRHAADKVLQQAAWRSVKAGDSSLGEKSAALLVAGLMKAKRTLGMGMNQSKMKKVRVKRKKTKNGKGVRSKRRRVIKTPKLGGFIFTIPMILGALGALGKNISYSKC